MRSFVPAFMIAAAAGLAASPAAAQSLAEPRTWTVTPFLNTSLGVGEPALDDSIGLGVAVGYDLTPNLGFEGEINHLFDVAGSTDNIDWSVSTFSGNAIYHFDVQRVTPYATFGIGLERSSYDLKATDPLELVADPSSSEIAINFGGGAKYRINDRWIARGDLRRFQANDIAPDYWRLYGGLTVVVRR
ncbi:MAG: outer membrane protein [Vicinamibacterales bacterium]